MEHTHCQTCVSVPCHHKSSCSVDYCPNGCGFSMHQCKLSEHEHHTCPEAMVPCLNAGYGCTEQMRRREIRSHIEHCPASNVICCFSHQRIEPEQLEPIKVAQRIPNEVLVDKNFLEGDLKVWRTSGHQAADQLPPKFLPDVEAGLATKRYMYQGKVKQAVNKRTCITLTHTVTSCAVYCKYLYGIRNYPQLTIAHERQCCVFTCGQVVRRDEFSAHWKTLHEEIQLGDLVYRCPMRLYGCQYGVLGLTPHPKGSTLDYDPEIDCFLHKLPSTVVSQETDTSSSQYAAEIQKKQELAMYGYEDIEEESFDVLGQLPAEVLIVICGFLDSQGLWALSQVNHYLRKVCFNLGKKAGIVYQNWERNNSGAWDPGPMVWSFSKEMGKISGWSYTNEPSVSGHMMSCDFIKDNLKSYDSDKVFLMDKNQLSKSYLFNTRN